MSVSRTVPITNKRGLHARASAKFVQLAGQQPCEVHVTRAGADGNAGGETVTGTSIMGLMMLGAAMGDSIVITADGDGAQGSVDAMAELVEGKFGEE